MKKKRKSRKIKRKIFTGLTLLALLVGMAFFLVSGDNLQVVKSMFRDDMSREEIQDTLSLLGWDDDFVIQIEKQNRDTNSTPIPSHMLQNYI